MDLSQFGEAGFALMGLFAWLAGDRDMEDQEFLEAHKLVHDAVVNGDETFHGLHGSHDLRDQLTPEQFAKLQEEAELRQMDSKRN